VVQSLIENRNVLTLPNRLDDRRFDLGFVSDLLIGMVGAFASLIIGLAVLSERFFYDPVVAAPGGASGGEAAGGAGAARAFAGLVMSIPTWVRLATFGALTGYASRRLLPDLSNKIANMVSGALDKGVRNQVENDRTQTELLGILARTVRAQDQNVAQAHNQAVQAAQAVGAAPPAPVEGLLPLVNEITAINEPDYRQRVARLREIADKMPGAAFVLGVSAADILARIRPLPAGDPSADGWRPWPR
jgi:hypothetical protein